MKEKDVTITELLEKISQDLDEDYSIAVHNIVLFKAIYKLSLENPRHSLFLHKNAMYDVVNEIKSVEEEISQDIVKNIMAKGLIINKKYDSVFMTIWGYGYLKRILENDLERKDSFITYNYWKQTKVNNIIIAVPPKIRLDGKEYFVGVLETPSYSVMHDFPKGENVLNTVLLSHKIPSEFIYGSYSRDSFKEDINLEGFKDKKVFKIKTNPNHISRLSLEKQEIFYKNLLEEKQVPKAILKAVEEENQLLGDPVINTTIGQKQAYENEFQGRKK